MSTTFGRVVAVTALIVGPLSLIAGNIAQWLLQPAGAAPTAVDVAAQFPAAWLTIGLLGVFGPIVWLAGIPATAALAPRRGALVTRVGALITGAGLAAGIGHVALFFGLYGALAQAGLDTGAVGAMAAAADQEMLGNILLYAFLIGFSLGPIVLTVGLRIAGAVAVWVPIAAVITAGANLFGGPIAGIVQLIALVLVWAPLTIAVARSAGGVDATRRDTPSARIPQEI
ncbi:MAG TPA: hypothetical protein VFN24_13200 [Microbacterium sp.]|nr:hypothetical protein [Microbacterium sp.]